MTDSEGTAVTRPEGIEIGYAINTEDHGLTVDRKGGSSNPTRCFNDEGIAVGMPFAGLAKNL